MWRVAQNPSNAAETSLASERRHLRAEVGEEEVAKFNEPARRLGPVPSEMKSTAHDAAVLWSYTEVCMREKDITTKEAARATGEQILLMIPALPENTAMDEAQMSISAYTIGQCYNASR